MNAPAPYGERTVTLTRVYDAPRELVWRAWTDPKHLAQWFGPRGFTSSVPELDCASAAACASSCTGRDGNDYPMKGVFREVVPPAAAGVQQYRRRQRRQSSVGRRDHASSWKSRAARPSSRVHSYARGLVPLAPQMLAGMEAGWSQSLDKMGELVAKTG